ncbi:NHLP family bacteriocin export ABC transporter peptidase/permease/ATPase subunit [Legionella jordanis]|uniref:ABC transporter n=1 Tax=Legionella jordanis TaxID=456 RepID=A0A0W0VBN3_9GAMM|nr:NHLP family bacteriocin export ABC transporter peptidase/permease/ATPase subunit [Legionella jordanis]KTD17293.1 hypothetical protein Ljor_1599 [Legionella jordanis]RMW99463.1 NHLP family bacteriocin export ABC transporter peptidase/permease/ATPase subunit [Legionella jordanis]RMX15312.1 NHLP family bacteriocin export ABC transporter peptidase/permease/ATPase subunit [Legionella jordanis]VEH12508.1 ABC-type bacteriocin/lantibiotic exporters, contain an N-terminal double-glycine peptidase dom
MARLFGRRNKTATILQLESVECGSVALAIVLAFYGRWIPLDVLRSDCGVSRDGSRADNLVLAAEKHGLTVSAYSLEPEDVTDFHLPAIIHWEFNHFVVLEDVKGQKIFINDPAFGPRVLSWEEFDEGFTGVFLELKPGPGFIKYGHRPKVLPQLVHRLSQSQNAVIFIILATLALAIPGLAIPGLVKVFIDEILVQQMTAWQKPVLISLIIAACFKGLLTWYQSLMLSRLESKLSVVHSSTFFWRLLRLPQSFFSQRYLGDILSRFQSSDSIAALVSQQFGVNAVNLLLAFIYFFILLLLSIPLALVVLISSGINLVILLASNRKRTDLSARETKAVNNLLSSAISGLQMIETYKASGAERDFFQKFFGLHANYLISTQQLNVTRESMAILPQAIDALTTALILGLGAWFIMQGKLTIGTVVGFQLLYGNFSQPINSLILMIGKIQEINSDLVRVKDVTDHEMAKRYHSPSRTKTEKPVKLIGHVQFEKVTFGYSPLSSPLIENFSLDIKPGRRLALVGGSGSGKSTIGKLLLSHYQPWSGQILIDGMPLNDIPNELRTRSITGVDQDINLFEASVKDNLTLWDSTIEDEAILNAAKAVFMHDVIAGQRAGGYESMITEGGSNFSGGQRQRLEIARALLQKPSILILDEATSALDAYMEQMIDSHIRQLGCTLLIISHRLSAIRDADEIIVLDNGKVVERGTHQELLQRQGTYCRLLASET